MIDMDKEIIVNELHEKVCKVTFMKTNGEERVMYCTLNSSLIPDSIVTETVKTERKENPQVQAVYDVKAPGWRSFRWESLLSFSSEVTA